jgi:(1->4)-alpha-D-glucan 1-alpha-D-glucosylmutase
MQQRAKSWPQAISATSTHDTKRGEDARARLAVLSERAADWELRTIRWSALNRFRRHEAGESTAPSPIHEYLIYQTLIGAWPTEAMDEDTFAHFRSRMREAVLKSMRESKSMTSWNNPNPDYEAASLDFLDKILDDTKPSPFLEDFRGFVAQLAPLGMMNGLSQTVLKMTAPGIPDLYQGAELWDFSLVDPDNRRPVDFPVRDKLLAALAVLERGSRREAYRHMLETWQDGRIKLALLVPLLKLRKEERTLFLDGSYEPLEIEGPKADHALAFLRRRGHTLCLTVVGRLYAGLAGSGDSFYSGASAWRGTRLILPEPMRLEDIFTGRPLDAEAGSLPLDQILADLPVSVARNQRI